jgi:hypothetical protein
MISGALKVTASSIFPSHKRVKMLSSVVSMVADWIGWNDYTVYTITPNGNVVKDVRNREPLRYDEHYKKIELENGIEVWHNSIEYQRTEKHLFRGRPFHGTIYVYRRDARTGRYCSFGLSDNQ